MVGQEADKERRQGKAEWAGGLEGRRAERCLLFHCSPLLCLPHVSLPMKRGKATGGTGFFPHISPSAPKPSVPAFLPQKPAGLISSEEQRGGKMSPHVCRDLQLLGQPRQRWGGDRQSPPCKEGGPPPGWERPRDGVLLMLRGITEGHESWGTAGNR